MNNPKIAYRVDEAAKLLDVHPSTVYELVRAGSIPHKRLEEIAALERQLEFTFDNPENPDARWGRPYRTEGNRVWLEYIGWGYLYEVRGVRHIEEDDDDAPDRPDDPPDYYYEMNYDADAFNDIELPQNGDGEIPQEDDQGGDDEIRF